MSVEIEDALSADIWQTEISEHRQEEHIETWTCFPRGSTFQSCLQAGPWEASILAPRVFILIKMAAP